MSKNTYKGYYKPVRPEKYIGNASNVMYRSGWERACFTWLDRNENVTLWSSERIAVPYIFKTFDKEHNTVIDKAHNYFVDLEILLKNGKKYLIEIKPYKETLKPTIKGKKKTTQIYEAMTYEKNMAKWHYAEIFAKQHAYIFQIWTEKELKALKIIP